MAFENLLVEVTDRIEIGDLRIARELHDFVVLEALPGTGVAPDRLWSALDAMVHELAPRQRRLLARRDELQARIDALATRGSADERQPPVDIELDHLPPPVPRSPDAPPTAQGIATANRSARKADNAFR